MASAVDFSWYDSSGCAWNHLSNMESAILLLILSTARVLYTVPHKSQDLDDAF